jgi:hypothetical protein
MSCIKFKLKLSVFPPITEPTLTTTSLSNVKVNSKSRTCGKLKVSPKIVKEFEHKAKMLSTTLLVHHGGGGGRLGNTHFQMKRDADGREDRYLNTGGKGVRNCNPSLKTTKEKRLSKQKRQRERERGLEGLLQLT